MSGAGDEDPASAKTIADDDALAEADTVASDDAVTTAETERSSPEHATAPARAAAASGPVRGETWARYVVLEPLGAGGMGSVWAAYDPELDRKVALKVLHDELLGRANQVQLRREAMAMARVSHPNVVPVFDVGEHAGRTYYTMELVRGRSVRDWARTPRPWREVQRVFLDAARGLGAIHAAGLIHRDIKPGNLLVGDDGRARVVDLGIAMSDPEPAPLADATPLVTSTTLRRAGTPAYMAPEQLDGAAGDARSDQFAFGVALWEVLFGASPFPTTDLARRRAAMEDGPAGGDARAVPDWLVAVARRALAVAPAARFPDVDALARALEGPRRRGWPVAVAAAAGIAATIAIVVVAARGTDTPAATPAAIDPCAHAGHELDAWTPASSAALTARVAAHRWPRNPQPASVVGLLDTDVANWRTAARDACRRGASHSWSSGLDARATACLARRRRDLEVARTSPDVRVLATRVAAIALASRCLDPAYLTAQVQPPTEPGRAALVEATRAQLDVAASNLDGHTIVLEGLGYWQTDNARAQVELAGHLMDAAAPPVERAGFAPLSFQAASARAKYLRDELLYDGAEDDILHQSEAAYAGARAAGDDDDAERGLMAVLDDALAYNAGADRLDHWLGVAHTDVARQPDVDAAPLLLDEVAAIELDRGRLTDAIADAQRALDLAGRTYGDADPITGDALAGYGRALLAADRPREALPFLERELAAETAWFGAESVAITVDECTLAGASSAVGQHAKAIALAQRAVDAFRGSLAGAGFMASADEGRAYACLGTALSAAGRDVAALEPLDRGDKILGVHAAEGEVSGREKIATDLAYYRAWVRGQRGAGRAKIPNIVPWERTAIAESTEAIGANDSDTLFAATVYAETLAQLGKCRDAIAAAQPAADGQERGGHRARAVEALAVVAQCRLEANDPNGAFLTLQHADTIDGDVDPALRARVAQLQAETWFAQGAVEQARAYEETRRVAFAAADGDAQVLAAIVAWIAAPKGPPP